MELRPNTPVLIGAGQSGRVGSEAGLVSPLDLVAEAARSALADAGSGSLLASQIDMLAFVRLFADSAPQFRSPFGGSRRPAVSVARRIGASSARCIQSAVGGNVPQKLVNEICERIVAGDCRLALIGGGEALRTTALAARQGMELDWREDPPGEEEDQGFGEQLVSAHEIAHGIGIPVQTYPLFEHAIRGHRGRSVAEQLAAMGRLFEPFTRIAACNPRASFPFVRSASELVTVTPENRWIAHPYPKLVNAQDRVDQAAALVLTSAGRARELGVPQSKWVFLHGCADINEKLLLSERVNYWSSPAITAAATLAFEMAGLGLEDVELIDLYSCFPSAVEVACEVLGLAEDDPRGLTVTGGLPFFGGPGNAYSLCAIATMVDRLRERPGTVGLVTANGGYLSKHSLGIYSTRPIARDWQRIDCRAAQAQVSNMTSPAFSERPQGAAIIETYTVVFGRRGPERGIVIGRLVGSGARFIANTPVGRSDVLQWLLEAEPLAAPGTVEPLDGRNWFVPNAIARER